MYVALNPNEKLHIICALSWPFGGHFVCLMTAILVYGLSNIMFASHRGVYMKILHGCYQNHESASSLLNYINFCLSQMAAILDFTHNAISKVLSNHTTMSGIPENHMVDTKIMLLRPFCRK